MTEEPDDATPADGERQRDTHGGLPAGDCEHDGKSGPPTDRNPDTSTDDKSAIPTDDKSAIPTDDKSAIPTDDKSATPTGQVVLAQGTFDLLHPGHLHYLSEAAAHGEELHVIVARRANVTHKPTPVCPDRQRRDVLDALDVVDEAHVGHPTDYFVPVERIDPDVIVLGFDQHHDADAIRAQLRERGLDAAVTRATGRDPAYEGEILSTNEIVDRLVEREQTE